jgi:hypothetical protein
LEACLLLSLADAAAGKRKARIAQMRAFGGVHGFVSSCFKNRV